MKKLLAVCLVSFGFALVGHAADPAYFYGSWSMTKIDHNFELFKRGGMFVFTAQNGQVAGAKCNTLTNCPTFSGTYVVTGKGRVFFTATNENGYPTRFVGRGDVNQITGRVISQNFRGTFRATRQSFPQF